MNKKNNQDVFFADPVLETALQAITRKTVAEGEIPFLTDQGSSSTYSHSNAATLFSSGIDTIMSAFKGMGIQVKSTTAFKRQIGETLLLIAADENAQ